MPKKYLPHILVIALMVLTSFALAYTVDVALMDEPGVRMVLPDRLGDWTGDVLKYCHNVECEERQFMGSELTAGLDACPSCGELLQNMSMEEYDALPKDTQFVKTLYTNSDGHELFVSIVLSGRERSSIHRPQRCLVGQGQTIGTSRTEGVALDEQRDLEVTVLETTRNYRTQAGPMTYHSFYAYWFVGQGRETPSHLWRMFWLAWDRVVHGVAHKWAYVAVSGARDEGSDAYLEEAGEFLALLHDEIVL